MNKEKQQIEKVPIYDLSDLLTCPFCDAPAMIRGGGTQGKYGKLPYVVSCSSRICPVQIETQPIHGKDNAIRAWNTRKS